MSGRRLIATVACVLEVLPVATVTPISQGFSRIVHRGEFVGRLRKRKGNPL